MVDKAGHKYELRIYWSAEDGVFVVEVPDLPGCTAHGDTPAEAAANAQDAIALWIDKTFYQGAAPVRRAPSRPDVDDEP